MQMGVDSEIDHQKKIIYRAHERTFCTSLTFIQCRWSGFSRTVPGTVDRWYQHLRPTLVVITGYEHNIKIFNALIDHEYRYMDQFEFIEDYNNRHFDPQWEGRIAVIFQGHELYRGSGGVRCMIMPPLRRKLN